VDKGVVIATLLVWDRHLPRRFAFTVAPDDGFADSVCVIEQPSKAGPLGSGLTQFKSSRFS
jgi:hypothetical protein